MTGIDRDALINAAAQNEFEHDYTLGGQMPYDADAWQHATQGTWFHYRKSAARHLDAVLTLITDEIERTVERDPIGDWSRGRLSVAHMLRSLSQDGG